MIKRARLLDKYKPFIFIGGVKGVGKTKLINNLINYLPLNVISTGGTVRKYKNKNYDINKIIYYFLFNHLGIIDGHYVKKDLTPTFRLDEIKNITAGKNTLFLLLDAPLEAILERRKIDLINKKRSLNLENIIKEKEKTYDIFNQYVIATKNDGYIVQNINLKDTIYKTLNLIKLYYKD